MSATRVILYHKQSTSARTRFLALSYGGVCAFEGLPEGSKVMDEDEADGVAEVTPHPALLLAEGERRLGMSQGSLEADAGFRVRVDAAGEALDVYLAHFTSIDPPFETAEANGARFLDITQARGMPEPELLVLRRAYEWILG